MQIQMSLKKRRTNRNKRDALASLTLHLCNDIQSSSESISKGVAAMASAMFQLDLTLVKSDTYGKIEQINLRK